MDLTQRVEASIPALEKAIFGKVPRLISKEKVVEPSRVYETIYDAINEDATRADADLVIAAINERYREHGGLRIEERFVAEETRVERYFTLSR